MKCKNKHVMHKFSRYPSLMGTSGFHSNTSSHSIASLSTYLPIPYRASLESGWANDGLLANGRGDSNTFSLIPSPTLKRNGAAPSSTSFRCCCPCLLQARRRNGRNCIRGGMKNQSSTQNARSATPTPNNLCETVRCAVLHPRPTCFPQFAASSSFRVLPPSVPQPICLSLSSCFL
jgi:hypothetical protein